MKIAGCVTCLMGIDIQPHDIDIMPDSKNIINDIFSDYIVEPVRSSKGRVNEKKP
ncbi:MAG: hypothetical protein GX213_14360 [Clostridiaceae bacterium]|nr:hypothetical protein [Clostridiaceae bacterium]